MLTSRLQALLLAVALSSSAIITIAPVASAEDITLPATADDHVTLAREYQQKAAEYRKEAQRHHAMFEAYKKSTASSPKSPPPPAQVKMQQHCQVLAKDAEKLATDMDKAAEYHNLRAGELKGK